MTRISMVCITEVQDHSMTFHRDFHHQVRIQDRITETFLLIIIDMGLLHHIRGLMTVIFLDTMTATPIADVVEVMADLTIENHGEWMTEKNITMTEEVEDGTVDHHHPGEEVYPKTKTIIAAGIARGGTTLVHPVATIVEAHHDGVVEEDEVPVHLGDAGHDLALVVIPEGAADGAMIEVDATVPHARDHMIVGRDPESHLDEVVVDDMAIIITTITMVTSKSR